MNARPTLVSFRAAGLGDLLTVVPALRALRRAWPDHEHVLLGPRALAGVAQATGAIDRVVPVAGKRTLPAHLPAPAHEVEVAANLHGRGPRSSELLAAWNPCSLLAFAHPDVAATDGGPVWRDDEPERERWCRLLRESGIPADPDDVHLDVPPSAHPRIEPRVEPGTVLLHPGAAAEARRWPATRFAGLGRRLRAFGHPVAVGAGPGEVPLATAVAHHVPGATVVATDDDPLALLELVAAAAVVVCGDTGVAHVATAVGTPSVVLFGPVSPARWGPPPHARHHVALWAGTTGDPHGLVPDPGLLRIRVDDVEDAVHALLAERGLRESAAG